MENSSQNIIDVENLKVKFRNADNRKKTTDIIRDVSFSVKKGEIVGFIGESGSGKSVTAKSLFGMNLNAISTANKFDISDKSMILKDNKLTTSNKGWRAVRGNKVAYIPQNPMTSLNPTMKIGAQLVEPLKLHGKDVVEELKAKKESEIVKLDESIQASIAYIITPKLIAKIKTAIDHFGKEEALLDLLNNVKKSDEFIVIKDIKNLYRPILSNLNRLISIAKAVAKAKKKKVKDFDTFTLSEIKVFNKIKTSYDLFIEKDTVNKKEVVKDNSQITIKPLLELRIRSKELKQWIKKPYKSYAGDMLEEFGIVDAKNRLNSYPHEFSGGMKQRVVIAMAILAQPDLIIADEPTTALDPTIQASVLKLFGDIVKKYNVGVIFVSHDISVISTLCTYVNVFYAGRIVERANKFDLFTNPKHPYTWALLSSMPELSDGNELYTLDGAPPNFAQLPSGDAFSPRNKYAMEIDFREEAPLFKVEKDDNHYAATWLLHPSAPDVIPPVQVKTVAAQIRKDIKQNGKK